VKLTKLHGILPSTRPHRFAAPYATRQLNPGPCRDIQLVSKLPEMLVFAMCRAWRLLGKVMLLALPERLGLSPRMRARREAVPFAQPGQAMQCVSKNREQDVFAVSSVHGKCKSVALQALTPAAMP
jgi:hypothetical protein